MPVTYLIRIYYFHLCFTILYNKCAVSPFTFTSVMTFYPYWRGGSVIPTHDSKKWLFHTPHRNVFVTEDTCEG